MNKQDLINQVAEETQLSKKDVGAVIESVFGAIKTTLAKGEEAAFVGFGSFKASERAARKGRNPQTGDEIDIPASIAVTFKAGKALKDAANGIDA